MSDESHAIASSSASYNQSHQDHHHCCCALLRCHLYPVQDWHLLVWRMTPKAITVCKSDQLLDWFKLTNVI